MKRDPPNRIDAALAGDSIFVNRDLYRASPDLLMADRDQPRFFAAQVFGDIPGNCTRDIVFAASSMRAAILIVVP